MEKGKRRFKPDLHAASMPANVYRYQDDIT